jgi:hypothetical protein
VTCKANAISIAAIVCAGLLVVIVSAPLDLAILRHAITEHGHPLVSDMVALAKALAGLFVIGANASKFINVNRFSIHALYRNRLVRTFLEATRDPRAANPFTNFDE